MQGLASPLVGATDVKSKAQNADIRRESNLGNSSSKQGTDFSKTLDEKIKVRNTKEPPRSEPRETKVEARQDGAKTKKSTERQQKLIEFMDSFESEFQISPTRLVEAIAELSDSELQLTPEQTADAVIAKLDLSDEDAEKASAMYSAMLVQTSSLEGEKVVPKFTLGTGTTVTQGSAQRSDLAIGRHQENLSVVDKINSQFWKNPAAPVKSEASTEETLIDAAVLESASLQNLDIDEESFSEIESNIELQAALKNLEQAVSPSPVKELPVVNEATAALRSEKMKAMSTEAVLGEGMEASVEAPPMKLLKLLEDLKAASAEAGVAVDKFAEKAALSGFDLNQDTAGQESSEGQLSAGEGKSASELLAANSKKFDDFQNVLMNLDHRFTPPPATALAVGVNGAGQTSGASSLDEESAVKELMNKAQILIQKGGGEMKVEMSPEGLGKVHLKVLLQDGKVNVQMAAETQEAKSAIESSLAELKNSLAAHKLSVDNVKIDVVETASNASSLQNQANFNGQERRDETRQFWNQFQNNFGNGGRRDSLTDMVGVKGYGAARDPLAALETKATRKIEGKGSGLNLVA